MELLRRTFAQFRELYQGMSPSQRGTLIVVPMLILAALGLLMYTSHGPSEEMLLGGKYFSPDELARSQEALRQAGLTEFRVDNQRLAVPKRLAEKYTAALVVHSSLPADFAADLDRMENKINVFMPGEHRREIREEGRKLKLSKILRAIPEIEEAIVEWDRVKSSGFGPRQSLVTATVSVLPRGGRELSPQLMNSLRQFVAGAVAGLSVDNVTVMDMSTGRVPVTESDPLYDRVLALTKLRKQEYEAQIRQALAYIPDVLVGVNVDLENLKTSVERQQLLDPKPFPVQTTTQTTSLQATQKPSAEPGAGSNVPRSVQFSRGTERTNATEENREIQVNAASVRNIEKVFEGLFPKAVQVAVSIPDDYYRQVAASRGFAAGTTDEDQAKFKTELQAIEKEILLNVSTQVARLIPADSAAEAVSVKSVPSLERKALPARSAIVETVGDLAGQWGSAAALVLFALWALWMLNRSMSRLPVEPAAPNPLLPPTESEDDEEEEPQPQAPTKRDELQSLVRDNPEMAASVLARWIAPIK